MNERKILLVITAPDYNTQFYRRKDSAEGIKAPLGILLLATILRQNDFSVKIIDGHVCDCRKELTEEVNNGNLLCVGFSVMSSQYMTSAVLSEEIKRTDQNLPVVWGGFHPTMFPEQTVKNNFCDYVIRGEADKAFVALCKYFKNGGDLRSIPNLVYLDRKKVVSNKLAALSTFEELPSLDWSLLGDMQKYIVTISDTGTSTRRMNVLAGLGCNYRCAFCHNAIFKKKHRKRSPEDIIHEMNFLHEAYNISEFWMDDEDFFGDKARLLVFLDLLENNSHAFKWNANLRASYIKEDYVNRELLRRMAASGCNILAIGAESGSEVIVQKLMKDISLEDILRAAQYTKDVNICVMWLFMVGIPGETWEMTLKTLRLIETLRKIKSESILAGPQVYRPFPGSPLYKEALQKGLREPDDWSQAKNFLRSLSHLRKVDIKEIPWLDHPEKFKYIMLSYYVLAIKKNTLMRKILFFVPVLLSRWRLKTGYYSALFEKPFLDYMNKVFT